jgi:hypothetical protein
MSPEPRAEIKVLQLPWDFVAGVLRVVTLVRQPHSVIKVGVS